MISVAKLAANARWYERHRVEISEHRKEYWKQNKEHLTLLRKQRQLADPQYERRRNLKYRYGITLEQYNELLSKQEGRCAICKVRSLHLSVDHDHKLNTVRGLLCDSCNQAIGLLKEKEENFLSALHYLTGK